MLLAWKYLNVCFNYIFVHDSWGKISQRLMQPISKIDKINEITFRNEHILLMLFTGLLSILMYKTLLQPSVTEELYG